MTRRTFITTGLGTVVALPAAAQTLNAQPATREITFTPADFKLIRERARVPIPPKAQRAR